MDCELTKTTEDVFLHENMDGRLYETLSQMGRKDYIELYERVVGKDKLAKQYRKEYNLDD